MTSDQRGSNRSTRASVLGVLVTSAVRVVGAAVAGALLLTGLAVVVWAISPTSATGAVDLVRGGLTAFAAAHLVPIHLAGATLSVSPLLLTGMVMVLLASTTQRGSRVHRRIGPVAEILGAVVGAAVYALVVTLICRLGSPAGTVPSSITWYAGGLAAATLLLSALTRGDGLRRWALSLMPDWAQAGVRGGAAAAGVVVAGGMLTVVVSLAMHLPKAATLTDTVAPGAGGGLGLTLIGLAYLPNAAAAGAGYVTGAGFRIGGGDFSPFGSYLVDLPPLPMLAAVPQNTGMSTLGLLWLVVPVLAGLLVGLFVVRRLALRPDRMAAIGMAGLFGAVLVWAFIRAAAGGISPGAWPEIGAPAEFVAGAVLAVTWLVGGAWALAAPNRAEQAVDVTAEADLDSVDPQDVEAAADPDLDPAEQVGDPDEVPHLPRRPVMVPTRVTSRFDVERYEAHRLDAEDAAAGGDFELAATGTDGVPGPAGTGHLVWSVAPDPERR